MNETKNKPTTGTRCPTYSDKWNGMHSLTDTAGYYYQGLTQSWTTAGSHGGWFSPVLNSAHVMGWLYPCKHGVGHTTLLWFGDTCRKYCRPDCRMCHSNWKPQGRQTCDLRSDCHTFHGECGRVSWPCEPITQTRALNHIMNILYAFRIILWTRALRIPSWTRVLRTPSWTRALWISWWTRTFTITLWTCVLESHCKHVLLESHYEHYVLK